MALDPALVEATLTWLAAIGVLRYWMHVGRNARTGSVNLRARFLLACLFVLLLVRGFAWLWPSRWLSVLTFVPATLLPLALHMFVEGLLRRHLPRAMKIWSAVGTILFTVANLTGLLFEESLAMKLFAAFQALTLAVLCRFLLARQRASLAPAENRFIDAVMWTAAVALPLIATDFRTVVEFPRLRLGSLGALLFVYVCVRASTRRDPRSILVSEAARLCLRTAILGLPLYLVMPGGAERWLSSAAFAFSIVLLFGAWDRIWVLEEQTKSQSILRWLVDARSGSDAELSESLRGCPLAEEHVVLQSRDLAAYDLEHIVARLARNEDVLERAALSRSARTGSSADVEADEEIAALLETYGMTHALLVRREPPLVLLLNQPQMDAGPLFDLELALFQKVVRRSGRSEGSLA